MLNTFKATWGRNRKVIGNFVALSVVQFANYLVPLILIPYLTRVLGLSLYGLVELARAISVYFLMLTDYGFSLSATREVSIRRDDPERLSEVFSSVMTLKLLLVLLSAAVLSAIVFAVPRLRPDWLMYYLSFMNVVGMWLFPMWLFQGLERMKCIAVLTVVAKTLVVVGTVLFVRDPGDYLYVPLLHSGGTLLIGVAGAVIALWSFPVRFRLPSVIALKRELVSGWHLFISRMATTLYTTSNVVILGLFADNVSVAYFVPAQKIARAATDGLMIPLSQAIFPHIGLLASQSKQAALRFAAKVVTLLSVVTLAISMSLFFGAPYIARFVFDQDLQGGVVVIRILSFLPFIIGLSNVFGIQIMVNFGLEKTLTKILTTAGAFNVIVALSLVVPLRHVGVSLAAISTEVLVTVVMFLTLRRSGVDVLGSIRGGNPND